MVLSITAPASDGTAMLSVTRLWANHCSSLLRECEDKTANRNQLLLPLPIRGVDRVALDTVLAEARDMSKLLEFFDKNQTSGLQTSLGLMDVMGQAKMKLSSITVLKLMLRLVRAIIITRSLILSLAFSTCYSLYTQNSVKNLL